MFKNVKKEEITIPAQMSYLLQVREFIEHIGKKYRYEDKLINSFKLVIDEACTNVIRHGYRDIKNGEITIKAIMRRLSLTIIIVDQGKSYDIRQANTPDLAKYVDIGKRGGLGILMMRKLMDDIQYSVTERGNEMRLTKHREDLRESALMQRWQSLNMRVKYSIFASIIFTVVCVLIFVPLFLSVSSDVEDEVFSTTASGARSLADNTISDMLNDQDLQLFEKSRSLKNNYGNIIKEVYVVDEDSVIRAVADPLKLDTFGQYTIPEGASLIDTIGKVSIYKYSVNDSLAVFDLSTQIRENLLGGGDLLGYIHIWIDQQKLTDLINGKKISLAIILTVILIIGYLSAFFLIHRILKPFHSLADWVRQVVRGKVDQDEIDIDASDELGEIAQAFNEMTNKFREAQVTLVEQEKLQKELQVAQEIQQMLLPGDFPNVEGYEIASYYEAAKEVGGDLFDFVDVDEDTIGICVADVSGKGVPGSMIMTMIRTALRLESRGNTNPADVLAKVNRFVADDMKRGMFVTMFYVILDSRNRIIHYASAGHNPMILYRRSTKQTYYLNPSGFPVGIQLPDLTLFDKKIETDSIRLQEDDILVLYTDGITEAMNVKRELYREERFLDAIRGNSHLDVGEFVKSINSDIKTFTGGAPQNDDITFVSIKEKLMQSEVILRVHEQLMNMIESGKTVKDALEELRVSPHFYYKHKNIINRKGIAGLKQYLEEQDYVEKKHLSIETKAKLFDIIRKHPDYGPKRISHELRDDKYGNIKIDDNRLYNELVKMRLNTEARRRRFVEKGGKKRLKQPGTPLLTLDGQVILNFESAEKQVGGGKRDEAGQKPKQMPPPPEPDKSKPFKKEIIKSADQPDSGLESAGGKKSPGKMMHKPARYFETRDDVKPAETQQPPPEPEKRKTGKKKPVQAAAEKKHVKEKETKKQIEPKAETEKQKTTPTQEELREQVDGSVDQKQISKFFSLVDDDLQAIEQKIKNLNQSEQIGQDIKKINLILKIILKHPMLKELGYVKQVFEQLQEIFGFIDSHIEEIKKQDIYANVKDLLNYLEKDNKLGNYNNLLEAINQIGLINRKIREKIKPKGLKQEDKILKIREKLAQKKIFTKKELLESLSKDKEGSA